MLIFLEQIFNPKYELKYDKNQMENINNIPVCFAVGPDFFLTIIIITVFNLNIKLTNNLFIILN